MSISVGIVGLPNVGKSTLFNALTNLKAEAANYPFATIEPNIGIVPVPDERLKKLAALEHSEKIVPTVVEFHDIAGLVKNAHQGAGLGNQFLSHIREVDAIVEVVRFFDDPNVIHVEGAINPQRDMETIETELALSDLQLIEKKLDNLKSEAKSGQKESLVKLGTAQKYFDALSAGQPASAVKLTEEETKYRHEFPLLTTKPILYVANMKNNSPIPLSLKGGKGELLNFLSIDAQLESEISELKPEERKNYLEGLGLKESGLEKLIKASYRLLNLLTFFTAGPKETRAWTCRQGDRAPEAAGKIHTDFEQGFIKAEVINWEKLLSAGGWSKAREQGSVRTEGKDYPVTDGDVMFFRFNV